MQSYRLLPPLLPLLVLAACTEQEPPTGPAETERPDFSHTAGHKIVNSLADPGNGTCNATQCTLREAINDPASTEISFAPGLTGPITLAAPGASGGTLVINKTLSITGPGTRIVIRRWHMNHAFRIFEIGSGGTVTLTNLTIRGGKVTGSGPGKGGGGILNNGTLRLTNSVVAGNSAIDQLGGGGGGGIFNESTEGTLTLTDSRISDNSSDGFGGGIANLGRVTLTHSTVTGNSAEFHGLGSGGGIANGGTLTLTNSRVAGNRAPDFGGGIANNLGGTVTLTKSTVSGNSSGDGGGIDNFVGTLRLINSTVSGNTATDFGGGIANGIFNVGGSVTLRNSTVAHNSANSLGGGIFNEGGPVTLRNSLVALNRAPSGPDVETVGTVTARFSLLRIGNGSGLRNGVNGNQIGSWRAPLDPKLGPLANNGGPTRTHALLLGSPAIDAASTPDCPTTDQRGVLRPQGAACDIGSYERK